MTSMERIDRTEMVANKEEIFETLYIASLCLFVTGRDKII